LKSCSGFNPFRGLTRFEAPQYPQRCDTRPQFQSLPGLNAL